MLSIGSRPSARPPYFPPLVPSDLADPGAALSLWHALAPTGGTAPVVRACMISTPGGAIEIDGRSGGLGTAMDAAIYQTLRMRSELILVSTSTMRAENYGPATITGPLAHLRNTDPAPIWALSRTLRDDDIDHIARVQDSRDGGGAMELCVPESSAAPQQRARAAESGVKLRLLPGNTSDFIVQAVSAARREAGREVLVEPGPRLLAGFLTAGVLDELILSYAPALHLPGGVSLLPSDSDDGTADTHVPLRVVSAFSSADGGLYTRWAVGADS